LLHTLFTAHLKISMNIDTACSVLAAERSSDSSVASSASAMRSDSRSDLTAVRHHSCDVEEDSPRHSFPLVVAIDVGQKNLSLCALRLYTPSGNRRALLTEARERLERSKLERWEVVNLNSDSRTLSFVERSSAIGKFVKDRAALFQEAAAVIVEQQMHSLMRSMAAALFACISVYTCNTRLISQHSASKLKWDDIVECVGCSNQVIQYNQRKKNAIKCAEFLLHRPDSSTSMPGALCSIQPATSSTIPNMLKVFQTAAKKDDLADALLHLLVYDRSTKPTAKKRRLI